MRQIHNSLATLSGGGRGRKGREGGGQRREARTLISSVFGSNEHGRDSVLVTSTVKTTSSM